MIRQVIHKENEKAKIAFSTTNYHVFRSGVTATSNGMKVEGIGSKTKPYFGLMHFLENI